MVEKHQMIERIIEHLGLMSRMIEEIPDEEVELLHYLIEMAILEAMRMKALNDAR